MSKFRRDKEKVQVEQQMIHLIVNIIEMFPQYSPSQHLCHVLRRKTEKDEAYYWSHETLLKKFEDYYDELRTELVVDLNQND